MEATNNLFDFYAKFSTEQACRDFLEHSRWANGIICPKCGVIGKSYRFKDGRLFKCGDCRQPFTVRVGTIFEDSMLPLQKWFLAIYLATSLKKGISSIQLAKYLGITQKSAWFVLHRIRKVVEDSGDGNMLGGITEIDESYLGGIQKGHRGRASNTSNKATVFGAVERKGNIKVIHVPNSRGETLLPAIQHHIKPSATIMSDEYTVYKPLERMGYTHYEINHTLHFGIGTVHTNSIEGFWSQLKRGINGIYHHVSKKHLQLYCSEYEYRYNTRGMKDGERFENWMGAAQGKRLTHKSLIA